MNLKEALKFRFDKKTVTTKESGDCKVYHYFHKRINGVLFMLSVDDKGEWFGSIMEYDVKFYTPASFKNVIQAVKDGWW